MEDDDIANMGLSAYQSGDYTMAIELLTALTKKDTRRWKCRLYLAMAYSRVNQINNAM